MITKRIQEAGLTLPQVNPPIASYIPAVRSGSTILTSGQLPMKEGQLMMTGIMTGSRSLEEAQNAMKQCFLNAIAAALLVAREDEIKGVLKLGAFVASAPDFTDQHKVANGASDLAKLIFGDAGVHARFAAGVASLPVNATVELEVIFSV